MNERSRWLRAAVTGCAVLALASCTDAPGSVADPTPSADEPSGSGTPTSSTATPLAENAVESPGPLKDRLYRPDMLIFSGQELSDATVKRIKRLREVAAVEPIGLGQVTIENQALTVAAVDGATYRRFTPRQSAQKQAVWDRLAGGELAVREALGKRLQDDEGNVALGGGTDAPVVHIGAYAPQATTIDLVVNTAWVDDLEGMVFGNGLLLSTEGFDPSTIRKDVERIVGNRASVQDLDIASRLGLDPGAVQTAFLTGGSIASVVGTFNYTVLGGGRIGPDPAWVSANIATESVPILGSVTCHQALFPQLRAALEEIVVAGLADEIHVDEYAGCYHPRFIANTTTLSNHSFGLALDLNVPGNQRGTVGEMNREVVAIFEKWGFAWGGHWGYTDPMHFELARLVEPR
ncbi:M15 family metallopeptidase [Nocardioides sp.]|uniref:M15 family metallopeptidase n=1 Tax=Nocardioides sp. TaxID=35761 RepID=UPI002ED0FD6D